MPFTPGLNFTQDDLPPEIPSPEIISDYRGKIGSLIYAMKQTRVDIAYPSRILAKHMSNSGEKHIKALHQLLRYLKGTQDSGVTFVGQRKLVVDVEYSFSRMGIR